MPGGSSRALGLRILRFCSGREILASVCFEHSGNLFFRAIGEHRCLPGVLPMGPISFGLQPSLEFFEFLFI